MGKDEIHNKKKNKNGRLNRNSKKKSINPYILIVCEGEKTEPNYFKWYKFNCKQEINVELQGTGKNTISLVKEAIKLKKEFKKKENIVFDQVWIVFDRDSFEQNNYNDTFDLCKKNKMNPAYSNESFEIWYLLHFNLYNTPMHRDDAYSKVDSLFRKEFDVKYKKNMSNSFELLKDKQCTAIKRAKQLERYCEDDNELHNQNPSTSVYKLVEELNKYVR